MGLKVAAVTAFAELDGEADEVEELEEDERDDDGDDNAVEPDVEGATDDAFKPRLVASGIMDINMGAIVPGGVVGVEAGGNGHQKSYVDDVVGVRVTGVCRRNGPP